MWACENSSPAEEECIWIDRVPFLLSLPSPTQNCCLDQKECGWKVKKAKKIEHKEVETKGVDYLGSKKRLLEALKLYMCLLFDSRLFIVWLIQFWNLAEYCSIKTWNVKRAAGFLIGPLSHYHWSTKKVDIWNYCSLNPFPIRQNRTPHCVSFCENEDFCWCPASGLWGPRGGFISIRFLWKGAEARFPHSLALLSIESHTYIII